MPWLHELNWPGIAGGFIGRCIAHEREEAIDRALARMNSSRVLVQAEQVHGGDVATIAQGMLDDGGPIVVPGVDGLVTDSPSAALVIYVADCLAVYLADPEGRGVGLAHAGWRGLVSDIPGALVAALGELSAAAPGDLQAALSPCIGSCCFEVGEEVATQFDHIGGAVDHSRDKPHVDMVAVATAQLRAAGVREDRIEAMTGCTRCDPERFASYRWDPQRCGRNMAIIGLDP